MKMKHTKTRLTAAVLLALGSTAANALHLPMFELGNTDNNFTMLGKGGSGTGGTNLVKVMWDGTLNTSIATADTNMTIESEAPFFSTKWFARNVQVFAPGTYTFEACPGPADPVTGKAADGSVNCVVDGTPQTMVVGDGQVGVHMLFDWNTSVSIDVINVWNVNAAWAYGPNDGSTNNRLQTADTDCIVLKKADLSTPECTAFFATEWLFTSTDPDGNGVPGSGMIDGPFRGFNANFNIGPKVVPVPAAVWLMGSGLLVLVGVARRKKR